MKPENAPPERFYNTHKEAVAGIDILRQVSHRISEKAHKALSEERVYDDRLYSGIARGGLLNSLHREWRDRARTEYDKAVTELDSSNIQLQTAERHHADNLQAAKTHYQENQAAYHDQAVADAESSGVELKLNQPKE